MLTQGHFLVPLTQIVVPAYAHRGADLFPSAHTRVLIGHTRAPIGRIVISHEHCLDAPLPSLRAWSASVTSLGPPLVQPHPCGAATLSSPPNGCKTGMCGPPSRPQRRGMPSTPRTSPTTSGRPRRKTMPRRCVSRRT